MRIPCKWLSEWVQYDCEPEELAEALTMAGVEIENVEEVELEGEIDTVLEAKVTPNRGDWLSLRGIAREVSAIFDLPLTPPDLSPPAPGKTQAAELASVTVLEPQLCPRYSARIIEGVKVAESPLWIQNKLIAAGLRPINNIVDITNLVLLELGQPLHAFDLDLLRDAAIVVRLPRAVEFLTTIDEETRQLRAEDLIIADSSRPVALAGVMGGLETEVRESTTRVLLESAHFSAPTVRKMAKAHGMRTEASYRFERWVNPNGTVEALDRAAQLILAVAGGSMAEGVLDFYPEPFSPTSVALRPERVNEILGTDLQPEEMIAILRRLGFIVEEGEQIMVPVPTFRNDISRHEDLVEEIARIYGYNRISPTLPRSVTVRGGPSESLKLTDRVREVLIRCGLTEAVTFSLTSPAAEERAGGGGELISLTNPLTGEFCSLRSSLLPSLLRVAGRNLQRGNKDLYLFEIGKSYRQVPEGGYAESPAAGIFITGLNWENPWGFANGGPSASFFQLKAIINSLLSEFGLEAVFREGENPAYVAESSVVAAVQGEPVASLGQLAPELLEKFDVTQDAYYAEVDLEAIFQQARMEREYKPIARYPAAVRDLSVIVPESYSYEQLQQLIEESSDDLLQEVRLFDLYRGAQIPPGKKSLAISLCFQSPERTLTDEEVAERFEKILSALEKEPELKLRRER